MEDDTLIGIIKDSLPDFEVGSLINANEIYNYLIQNGIQVPKEHLHDLLNEMIFVGAIRYVDSNLHSGYCKIPKGGKVPLPPSQTKGQ